MTKNPIINALAATGYIFLVVAVMTFFMNYAPEQDDFFAPVVVISVFTLSAATMGYIFLFYPLTMYHAGKKQAGIELFLRTLGVFAVIVIFFLIILGFSYYTKAKSIPSLY